MAGVDVGEQRGKRRPANGEINMIPFIDLLMVTIAFLLITAVWITNSRISANVDVPGVAGCSENCPKVEKALNVDVREKDIGLVWKDKGAVVSQLWIPKQPVMIGEGAEKTLRYPDLARAVAEEWRLRGSTDPTNPTPDQAVIHTDDRAPFKELVAVLDAINAAKRDFRGRDGTVTRVPAFSMTFASR